MKTIKHKTTGNYQRLSDSEANIKVKSSLWSYCPKSEWKTRNSSKDTTETMTEDDTKEAKKSKKK